MEDVDLKASSARALKVKRRYDELNQIKHRRTWTNEEFMLGFVGDVGDLAMWVMAQQGARYVPAESKRSTRTCRLFLVRSDPC